MAQRIVRNLKDDVKRRLQACAHRHGRSAEEVGEILRHAVRDEGAPKPGLGSRIAARFAGRGVEFGLADARSQPPRAVELEP
jgi:plasmid stability protein